MPTIKKYSSQVDADWAGSMQKPKMGERLTSAIDKDLQHSGSKAVRKEIGRRGKEKFKLR